MPDGDRPRRNGGPKSLNDGRLTQRILERLQTRHLQFIRGVPNGRRMVPSQKNIIDIDK